MDSELVNILVVDDEPRNLAVLETVLDDPSYHLVPAKSGEEALLALMTQDFAVLVLDVRMPDMTGFELAQMVKERRRTARIPIIFLTAYYNEDQHILEGYGSGAVDYLHKPVNPAVLRSKVAVFAELHKKERALEAANRRLTAEVADRRRAEARLSELNESLDRRVTERTTELLASEARLLEANRRKDEFLATLAHELRNPLAPVRTALGVLALKGATTTPELRWAAEIIDRQVGAMSRLIDDLMDVSRINRGRIELKQDFIDLKDVLTDAIDTVRPLIEECRHALVVRMPPRPVPVRADRVRLAQAFTNLLNNAAKYMDPAGRIEVEVEEEGAGRVAVRVTDQGIGIPPDRLESVFEIFSQVESALSRSRGGLGIGLSLAQKLIQMHDGSVVAQSEGLGKGSRFLVSLPLSSHRPDMPDPPPSLPLPGAAALRILVADDNRDAADTLVLLLEMMGHEVRSANDGLQAVQAATEFQPQLVLLDIGMPRLNGYEACQRLRAQPGGADTTVIAVTGWGQPEDVSRAKQAGFDFHLVKPIDVPALSALIDRLAAPGAPTRLTGPG